jgi:methylglyoxal synthase
MNEFTRDGTSAPDPAIPKTFGGIGSQKPGKFDRGVCPEPWSPTQFRFVPAPAYTPSAPEYLSAPAHRQGSSVNGHPGLQEEIKVISQPAESVRNERIALTSHSRFDGMQNPLELPVRTATRLLRMRKRIALVANDNCKGKLGQWALKHKARLIRHELYATGHTGELLADTLQVPVVRFLSGPLGGDQQIGNRIAEGHLDLLIFFWDPLVPQPHDSDVKALLRMAAVWNIPHACNTTTADYLISSSLFDQELSVEIPA